MRAFLSTVCGTAACGWQVDGAAPAPGTGTILFNNSKRETHHPNNGFKKLGRRLKGTYKLAT